MSRQKTPNHAALTPAQARYVGARAIATQQRAAKLAGVSERTATRWEALPTVRRALRAHVDATLADSARQAAAMQAAALAAIAQILADKTAPGPLRLAAARAERAEGDLDELRAHLAAPALPPPETLETPALSPADAPPVTPSPSLSWWETVKRWFNPPEAR